jgi:uncharacterized protein (DUF2252 family)
MKDIRRSTRSYEDWLRRQLGSELVEKDLEEKHEKMRESAFAFLRATYWRWAETVLHVCPDAADAPRVLAVGDIHLENFGTWRDADGRLVWGINDFDEAAEMPYVLDLIRLAASGVAAADDGGSTAAQLCSAILDGYRQGLKDPRPVVLDRDRRWLRELVEVSEKKRAKFWKKIEKVDSKPAPARYLEALAAGMPEAGLTLKTARRTAGVGSLGRPRWIGIADWRGAPVVREAKALVPSAWQLAHGEGKAKSGHRCGDIAKGRYRAIDPWYRVEDTIVVRRLSPNNRKIEADNEAAVLLSPQMLEAMGGDLAGAHLGTADRREAIATDLKRRKRGWLAAFAINMAAAIDGEHQEWKRESA